MLAGWIDQNGPALPPREGGRTPAEQITSEISPLRGSGKNP